MATPRRKSSGRQPERLNGLHPVSLAARPIVKQALPKQSAYFSQLFDNWLDVIAFTSAEGTIPEKLVLPRGQKTGATVHIWTSTSAQAMEIMYLKPTLLHKINALFGFSLVCDVRPTAFAERPKESAKKINAVMPKPCQSLDKALEAISNPQLKAALYDLGCYLDSPSSPNGLNATETLDA